MITFDEVCGKALEVTVFRGYHGAVTVFAFMFILILTPCQAQTNTVTIDGDVTPAGDWNDETCTADLSGQEGGGQTDLAYACGASNFAATGPNSTVLYFRWDWEVGALSGGNSGDACALFDLNANTFIDAALCVQITGNPAVFSATSFLSCNDTKVDRCAGKAADTFTGVCTVDSQVASNPWAANPDTDAECSVPLSDFNVAPTSVIFMDMCSFPSGQENSNPFDCVLDGNRISINIQTGVNGLTSPTSIGLVE